MARNSILWIIGPDDAPSALEVEQTDGQVYPLCSEMKVDDATYFGYLMAKAGAGAGMAVRQSLESRCG